MIRLRAATVVLAGLLLGCDSGTPPPPKTATSSEFPSLSDMLVLGVLHKDYLMCAAHSRSIVCLDEFHWKVDVNNREAKDGSRAIAFIQSEAKRVAQLRTEVAAESGAPYEQVQKVLAACEAAGIVKLTLTELKEKLADARASPLGVGVGSEILILIGKQVPPEKVEIRWIEAAQLKDAIGARKDIPIVLKPLRESPWGEVMGIRDSCLKLGFSKLSFAAPAK